MKKILLIGVILLACCTDLYASTLYMSTTGTDGPTCGSSSSPCATYAYTVANRMSGGDTLIVKDGTYTNDPITNPPSGSAGAYTVIKAETDGGAVFVSDSGTSETLRITTSTYYQIEGFKFIANAVDGSIGSCYIGPDSNHGKILRSGFVATPVPSSTGGSPNHTNVVVAGTYMLFEDCWAWGGGRYKFQFYGGDTISSGSNNIFRRCVARHDAQFSGSIPQACFINYQGSNNQFQNCIAIDSNQNSYYLGLWRGAFFYEKGQKAGTDNNLTGSIALSFTGSSIHDSNSMDQSNAMYTGGDLYISNSVFIGGYEGFISYFTYPEYNRAKSLNHVGFINQQGYSSASNLYEGATFYGGYNSGNGDSNAIATNSIFCGNIGGNHSSNGAIANVLGSNDYNSFYNNDTDRINSTTGAHDITNVNPLSTSLLYPVRIESGTPLKGAGSGGSDIGPTILKRIGVSGTLYGETGYDTVTDENLWPWPNEDRIKADMSSYPSNWPADGLPSPTRGFCGGTSRDGSQQTLTKYVWEYLGSTIPSSVYAAESTGSLTVTLSPAGAVTAGAQWAVDGGNWQDSGTTVTGLSAGSHTITYKAATGYTSPESASATIVAGEMATASGTYAAITATGSVFHGVSGSGITFR